MEGWQTKPIGEVFRVVNGGTPKTGTAAFWDGPHQWITPAEMGGLPSPYLASSRRTLTDEGLRVGAELVPPQSVILSSRAPIGHLVINEVPMAFNQGCKGLVPSRAIHTKFAYYFLLANVPLLESLGTGATFKELSSGKLKEVPFHFPLLPEQRRIVAILDEAFEAIATAKANTEKNLQNARELFESRLAHVFSSVGDDWKEQTLGSTCVIARGGSPRPIQEFLTTEADGINWIKISDATASGKYISSTAEKIKPAGVSRSRLVRDGDFLLSNSMSFGRPYIMRTTGCIHDGWLVLSEYQESFDQDFLYLLLGSQFVYRQFDRLAAGSTVRNLNIDLASSVRVPVPPLQVQVQMAGELGELSEGVEQIAAVRKRKLAALDELKKSLLHQAFTGQLTAKSTDQQLEAVA
ncbi:restriction endonuclease subunit S [Aquariibacter lacus]|nr:restriction endonuclease subunit S [Piscinibacter lacus]